MSDKNVILLCPGQGAQKVGMGKEWFESSAIVRDTFGQADAILADEIGGLLSEICFEGPSERLNETDVAQPGLYTCAVASYRALAANGDGGGGDGLGELVGAAGLSLGEYTALHIAGAFSFEDGLRLVAKRGRYMQEAAVASEGGMVAVTRPSEEEAEVICERARGGEVLVCANFNAPGQIVLSGSKGACERAVGIAEEMGHRATVLAVAGAFHSPLMGCAVEKMGEELAKCEFSSLKCPVVSNVTAEPHGDDLSLVKELLLKQIVSPVRWSQSCEWMVSHLAGDYHEAAPGKVLMGLMRRIDRNTKVIHHDQP